MKKAISTAILGLMTTLLPQSLLAGHPELENIGQIKFSAPPAARYTLENGLVIYLVKDNTLPVIHASTLFKVGTSYDPKELKGLAEMTTELMRDGGTAKYAAEDLDKTLEYLGSSIDASAYTEEAGINMTVLKKDLDKVLDIYADVILRPAFEEKKTEIEREAFLEIIRRRNDSPSRTASREARRMFYGKDHPYGWRPEPETVKAITKSDMESFHSAHFTPDNAIMVFSGDFESEEKMLAKLRDKFGGWKGKASPRPSLPAPAFAGGRKIYLIDKPGPQTNIVTMQPGIGMNDPERYPLSVLTDILGSGFQSRLVTEIRTKRGLAYVVGAGDASFRDFGFIMTSCGTKPETYSQALTQIIKQIELVGSEKVTPAELERSKSSIINPFVFKFSTPHRLAIQRAAEEFYGRKKGYLESYVDDISMVSAESALAAGRKYFDPKNMMIFVIGDAKKFDKPLSEFGPVTELKED